MRLRPLTAVAAAAIALLGACQGGDEPGPDRSLAAADKVCASAQTRIDDIDRPAPGSGAEASRWAARAADLVDAQADDLRDLRPPSPAVRAVASDLDDLAAELERAADVTDDAARTAALEGARSLALDAGAEARRAGFVSCGRPLGIPSFDSPTSTTSDGGGGETSGDEEFVAKAGGACESARQRMADLPPPEDQQSIHIYLTEAFDIVDGLGRELSALEPPPGAEVGFREMLASLALEAKDLADARQAHGRGDGSERDAKLESAGDHQVEFGTKAAALGLDACARFAG